MYCLHFPTNPQNRQSDFFTLVTPGPHSDEEVKSAVSLKAQDTQLVDNDNDSETVVYKANMHSNVVKDSPMAVVCKYADGPRMESLSQEAQVYQTKLSDLQGAYVPRFLGLYRGMHPKGYTVAIMVLSDEGREMSVALKCTPLPFRLKVIECLMKIHRAGIRHLAFHERNIVAQKCTDVDGECPWVPKVVDFAHARDHKCECTWDEVRAYDYVPHQEAFRCNELWWAFHKAELWQPAYITVFGRDFPAEWTEEGAEAFAEIVDGLLKDVPEDQRVAFAQTLIDNHQSWMRERRRLDEHPLPPVWGDAADEDWEAMEEQKIN